MTTIAPTITYELVLSYLELNDIIYGLRRVSQSLSATIHRSIPPRHGRIDCAIAGALTLFVGPTTSYCDGRTSALLLTNRRATDSGGGGRKAISLKSLMRRCGCNGRCGMRRPFICSVVSTVSVKMSYTSRWNNSIRTTSRRQQRILPGRRRRRYNIPSALRGVLVTRATVFTAAPTVDTLSRFVDRHVPTWNTWTKKRTPQRHFAISPGSRSDKANPIL